jgi:hypothetical protein
MEFFNNATYGEIIDRDVDVYVQLDSSSKTDLISALVLCRTFVRDGALWVDCAPDPTHLRRKYTAPVPDDAIVARQDTELDVGKYGIFVPPESELGRLANQLLAARATYDREKRKPQG